MARMTISGDTTKVLDAALGGNPNPQLKAWFDFAKGQKNVVATTDNGISGIELESTDTTIDPVLLALSQGFTVDGAPIVIKMTTAEYAEEVPEGISNRSYTDELGAEVVRTWADWHDETHNHAAANDGDMLVFGNSYGVELESAELLILLVEGYTIMLAHEAREFLEE